MDKFIKHEGLVCLIDRANIDTDAIIPKQFLKKVERTGFGEFLFFEWRFDENGEIRKDFILNKEEYKNSTIMLTGNNLGCGSSREHAPWAILDYGFKVLIAESFADIFYNNCFKNGILPIVLPKDKVDKLFSLTNQNKGYKLKVDLETKEIVDDFGLKINFEIDDYRRDCLLNGLDDIAITLKYDDEIKEYENTMNIR